MTSMAAVLESAERWHVQLADCLYAMSCLPDASVDAIVCDPPYGLEFMGKDWDSFRGEAWRVGAGMTKPGIGERAIAWPSFGTGGGANATCTTCGGRQRGANVCSCERPDWVVKGQPLDRNARAVTMRAFQAWCEEWATEALRVLKPGGHLLAFGGTRTFHRMTCAIEDAGFEVRDSIAWMHSQGFPKSLSVSKAIDAAAGAAREVLGPYRTPDGGQILSTFNNWQAESLAAGAQGRRVPMVTAPATPEARKWDGFGTALKPAWEPVVVARKPPDGTVAANVLKHGTGALNIDGCRVHSGGPSAGGGVSGDNAFGQDSGWNAHENRPTAIDRSMTVGRWPPNVLFSHAEGCRKVGAWECVPGCPVAALDAQSGERPGMSGGGAHAADYPGGMFGAIDSTDTARADTGGASRFFPQFQPGEPDVPFYYTAKAARSERDAGMDDFPQRTGAESTGSKEGQARLDSPRTGVGRTGGVRNTHPTVKPVDLMRHLVRLVTPPGGVVLDPFCGSGTTGVAAMLEAGGFRFLGIEREPEYVAIAEARLKHAGGGRWKTTKEVAAEAAALPEGTKKQLALF